MGLQGEGSGESDMAEYCAFCFPAVVQVVGPEKWNELEAAFLALVKNVQWKVRKMLSHSLHEIARIVGKEIAEKSLIQAFDLFLRDLDEVKVGIVQNLSEFLTVLGKECREKYIPLIFQLPSESDNWRLRYMIAMKLGAIAGLVSTQICKGKVADMGIKLLEDSVADVRQAAYPAASQILMHLCIGAEEDRADFLKYLRELPKNTSFQTRQMFVNICAEMGKSTNANVMSCFEQHFLPAFLELGHDKVPNVRIAVAKATSQVFADTRYEAKVKPLREQLTKDPDRDVAYFASQPKQTTSV
jgi:serine/threonine-protein phosphatase 4 regulatory subunit 1